MNTINRTILITLLLLLSILTYAGEVSATNQGIANANPGDYIIRSSGEKVVLKQADIDYARGKLGLPVGHSNQSSQSYSSSSTPKAKTNTGESALVIIGILVVIGVSVSNITTAVAKNSGMDDESAKKVGKSAGVLAGLGAA